MVKLMLDICQMNFNLLYLGGKEIKDTTVDLVSQANFRWEFDLVNHSQLQFKLNQLHFMLDSKVKDCDQVVEIYLDSILKSHVLERLLMDEKKVQMSQSHEIQNLLKKQMDDYQNYFYYYYRCCVLQSQHENCIDVQYTLVI